MKLFLDSLVFLIQAAALLGLAWGGWIVLRESLAGTVFPDRKEPSLDAADAERTMEDAYPLVEHGAGQTRRAA